MSRLPDQVDAPITPRQLATLRALSAEAYQPKLLEPNLTAQEADRRIGDPEGGNRTGELVLGPSGGLELELGVVAARGSPVTHWCWSGGTTSEPPPIPSIGSGMRTS